MGKFQYSLQARFDCGDVGFHNIGIMVWSEDVLGYYAVRGEEKHADEMCERILASRDAGRQIEEFVEYFLTPVSYTHLRAHETVLDLVCRLLLEKKKKKETTQKH